MAATYQTLLSDSYLRAVFDKDFQAFEGSNEEMKFVERLEKWSNKDFQKETSAENAFTNIFFEETWGYISSGKNQVGHGYTYYSKFPIPGAGAGGGVGEADAALGVFGTPGVPPTPQVICEFKDVRSNLDGPQKRKENNRSPVKQCADYLREATKPLFGNEAIQPTWGIVTDMNEIRLYWRSTMPSQYQRFIITKATTDEGISLLGDQRKNSFQRFLFVKLFHADSLLTNGGSCNLLQLLKEQRFRDEEIEKAFYLEYRAYRERLVDVIINCNPAFPGTKGRLVRLAQKLIDRCIFVMFCEDMGEQLSFPPNALRDYLSELSKSATFESDELDAWNKLKELFSAMNEGKKFRSHAINKFNGGLFAVDPELDGLSIPNDIFCTKMQGENDDTLKSDKLTLLYFAGGYNFGASDRAGQAITLYTLGRIFEQSITELEALEAAKEKRESLTVVSKRKRDGVYYTPEWIVERVVAETLNPRLDEIRAKVGWNVELEGDEETIRREVLKAPSDRTAAFRKHEAGVRAFEKRLAAFTVLDPACGSGAFLIYTLEFLLKERKRTQRELALLTGGKGEGLFEFRQDDEIRDILAKNIFGVDINSASVEIAQLTLWLHTAKSDQPLSKLDSNITAGNSLVGHELYSFKNDLLSAEESKKELINAFDYEERFPAVFDKKRPGGPGFDCIVGNPPYVKLQNFKKVYPETADFLRNAVAPGGLPRYESCQTGSFDLYLPFIERGIELLNEEGRLGYIAPSVWRFNKYAAGLKSLILSGRHLARWVDFMSFQVFEEATTYTSLQFYQKAPSTHVQVAMAPQGILADIPDWSDQEWRIEYEELPKTGPWVFANKSVRALIRRLQKDCFRLSDDEISSDISQGLISGMSKVFINDRVSKGLYISRMGDDPTEIKIESAACLPIISAEDIDPYLIRKPVAEIIFPYAASDGELKLVSEEVLLKSFPLAHNHLTTFREKLEERDSGKLKGDQWYAFSRTQNLDKQSLPKVVIAGTGQRVEAAVDLDGSFATNDKRVYSVYPVDKADLRFIAGILNSQACNFVFRHMARPKDGGYFDIETQFLSPLPIPRCGKADKEKIAKMAIKLEALYSERQAIMDALSKRFAACEVVEMPVEWLWPTGVQPVLYWKAKAPTALKSREATAWAKEQQSKEVNIAISTLSDRLRPNARIQAKMTKGELMLEDEGVTILDGVFVDKGEAEQTLINWRHYFRSKPTSAIPNAANLSSALRRLRKANSAVIGKQIVDLDAELTDIEEKLATAEDCLDKTTNGLFALTAAELSIIKGLG